MKINIDGWLEYTFDYLFRIKKGKRLIKEDMTPGPYNYLGAISSNNGVRDHILVETKSLFPENCITVNYNGSVGEAFYQSEPFWPSDDVNILYARDWWSLDPTLAMFIITVIKANKYKFDYGRKWTVEKMKDSTLLLPSKNGEPDWDAMRETIQALHNQRFLEQSVS